MPIETIVKENIEAILHDKADGVDITIKLCLYCMKTQIFNDGNKRASVIFANHYIIAKGQGMLVIPRNMFRNLSDSWLHTIRTGIMANYGVYAE